MTKPTIGIEIELPWKHMLMRVDPEAAEVLANGPGFYSLHGAARERVQAGFDSVDQVYKDVVQGVFGPDIKERSDGYTEFAFTPKRDSSEIVEVAAGLYQKGILIEDEVYPLHVTLGGVAAQNNSWLILMAAELSGGASAERIQQINTWSQKGQAGIKARSAAELDLGCEVGIEMRTLEVAGLSSLETVLRVSQTAGCLLLQRLAGKTKAAKKWKDLHEFLITEADSKDVDARVRWPNPQDSPAPWQQLARAMEDESWLGNVEKGIKTILLTN